MREVLADIRTGKFARQWIAENAAGKPRTISALIATPIWRSRSRRSARGCATHMAWLQNQPDTKAA